MTSTAIVMHLLQVRKEADALRNSAKEAAKQVSEQRQVRNTSLLSSLSSDHAIHVNCLRRVFSYRVLLLDGCVACIVWNAHGRELAWFKNICKLYVCMHASYMYDACLHRFGLWVTMRSCLAY